jgi:hypothetical protein
LLVSTPQADDAISFLLDLVRFPPELSIPYEQELMLTIFTERIKGGGMLSIAGRFRAQQH